VAVTIEIDPWNLATWLKADDLRRRILILDLEIDALDERTLHFDLDVAFSQVSIRRGLLQPADYYIATKAAEIVFEVDDGSVIDWTKSKLIEVRYENVVKRSRRSEVTLAPKAQIKAGSLEIAVSPGSVKFNGEGETQRTASFSGVEGEITAIRSGNAVRWIIVLPRGEKATRDFRIGNLDFFALCRWQEGAVRRGQITVRPSDLSFFDNDRRPLTKKQSIMMWFQIARQKVNICDPEGFTTRFREAVL
jgi:hypothetical protein